MSDPGRQPVYKQGTVQSALDASRRPKDRAPAAEVEQGQELTESERKKRERDKARVRLRLDVPAWLRERIEAEADGQQMSWSQFAAFLLAWGVLAWDADDPKMHEALEACKTRIASLRWQYAVDLDELAEAGG